MTILTVDDNPVNLKLLRVILEHEGHEVLEARDGVEALEILGSTEASVIISDILMPRMDGYRLCYELRQTERGREIPLIFYTATYTSQADERLAMDLGADRFLRKPTSTENLLSAIQEVLSQPRTPRTVSQSPREIEVMKEYSERLVAKLEEKNSELVARNQELTRSDEQIRRLNTELEVRVGQRTQELTKANQELEAFSYSISHDLRAPIRHIIGYAKLLKEESASRLQPDSERYLQVIGESATRMSELIDDLLEFSRMARVEALIHPINLDTLVAQAIRDVQGEAGSRSVQWNVGSLGSAMGDASLLRQVLVNLLHNALKFTRLREPAKIEIGRRDEEGEIIIYVKDNGVGFDSTYQERLFRLFQRLHPGSVYEGTGVGLASVQRIVQRHGGRVWAESTLDVETTFSFSLPAREASNSTSEPDP